MSEYTPGPWLVTVAPDEGFQVYHHTESLVVLARDYWHEDDDPTENEDGYLIPDNFADISEERVANARLIAAAPDLLAALQEFVDSVQSYEDQKDYSPYYGGARCLIMAKAAIAKAKGMSQ